MKKNFIEKMLPIIASVSLVFLGAIALTLIFAGFPIFKDFGVLRFLFGSEWQPTAAEPEFGIMTMSVASWIITITAVIIALPLGICSAVYISEMAGARTREIIKPIMEVLAGIPSVVFGFFGIVFIAPIVQNVLNLPTGQCGFTAALILGIMAVPIIASITEDAIAAVPQELRHASYALGANKWETIVKVVLPAARSGIFTAIILGVSRTMGETMTVLMVGGNAVKMPGSLFEPMRAMTASIALEMGEAVVGSLHYHALFGIGIVLFVFNLCFSLIAEIYVRAK